MLNNYNDIIVKSVADDLIIKSVCDDRIIRIYNSSTILAYDDNKAGNIAPCLNLSFNKDDVIRYNKKSVSTCNIEFLAYVLAHDPRAFDNVFFFVYTHALANDLVAFETLQADRIKKYNSDNKITRPAFYARFNDNIDNFVSFFASCSQQI